MLTPGSTTGASTAWGLGFFADGREEGRLSSLCPLRLRGSGGGSSSSGPIADKSTYRPCPGGGGDDGGDCGGGIGVGNCAPQ